jgi:ribosomal 50S subunit-associated protein YjgA (DUF615 family)
MLLYMNTLLFYIIPEYSTKNAASGLLNIGKLMKKSMEDITDKIVERPSKSQAKREAAAIYEFAQRLARLTAKQYNQLDLPEEICDALNDLKQLSNKAARGRQVKYVGTLIRKSERCTEIMNLNLDQL